METYTVIRYEFGFTRLIYNGVNRELAYQNLHNHKQNYLHTWANDQEIRYEGDGVYREYAYHNGKRRLIKEIENYRKSIKKKNGEEPMVYKEYAYPNGRKKLVKKIENYQLESCI